MNKRTKEKLQKFGFILDSLDLMTLKSIVKEYDKTGERVMTDRFRICKINRLSEYKLIDVFENSCTFEKYCSPTVLGYEYEKMSRSFLGF